MKYGTFSYTALAAAIGLACGAVSAQDDVGEAGVEVQPRIEASDEGLLDRQRDPVAGQSDQEDLGAGRQAADESRSDSAQQGNPEQLDSLSQEHQDLAQFVEAVKAAGLAESLTGDTQYTVFAPTDEALESMPEDWLAPENREQLVAMLRAHIVADDVDQETARTLQTAQTIDGGTIELSSEEDQLMVGDATVVEPDIQAGNLRIHAIDQVLSEGDIDVAAADPGSSEERSGAADVDVNERAVEGAEREADQAEDAAEEAINQLDEAAEEADERL